MDAVQLARRFGLAGRARLSDEPVARGKQGVVWRMQTEDGLWAVKEPFHRSSEERVSTATRFQEAAHAGGVPTPRVLRTPDGSVLADLEGHQVRVYEWVDLHDPDPGLDPAVVGDAVAAIHQVAVPLADEPTNPWHCEPVGAERWTRLVEQLRRAGAPFANRLADLRDELVALETWLEPAQTLQTCHRDLWADNVLPTPDGGVCIIDWEESGPADPSQELGCVLFEFARSDPGRVSTLLGAYAAAGGPGTVTRRGHFTMLIAQLGHITEAAAADWLQPNPRSPDRAASTAWISEVFDEPHTREVLDGLLAAASTAKTGS